MSNFSSVGINVGLIKYIAESHSGNKDRIVKIIVSGLMIVVFCTIGFTVFGIFFSKQISGKLLDSPQYNDLIIISFIGLPLTVLYNYYRSIYRGLLDIKKFILAGIFNSFATVFLLYPLIHQYQLRGAIWAITIAYFLTILMIKLTEKDAVIRNVEVRLLKEKADYTISKDLIKFGFASIVAGSSTLISLLFIRTVVVRKLGMESAGYFQAIFAISSQSITIILDSIGTYAFPYISSLKDRETIIDEMNNVMRLAAIITVPIISGVILFKEVIIPILYSREFLPIIRILPIQLMGDFFKIIGWSMGVALLPLKRLKMFVCIDILVNLVFIGVSIGLVHPYGIKGICIGYMVSFMVHPVLNYVYLKRSIGYHVQIRNIVTLASSVVIIFLSSVIHTALPVRIGLFVVLMSILLATLTRTEKLRIKEMFQKIRR